MIALNAASVLNYSLCDDHDIIIVADTDEHESSADRVEQLHI